MRTRTVWFRVAVIACLAAACAPDYDSATQAGDANVLARFANLMPDDPDEVGFAAQLVDLDLAASAAGTLRPPSDASADEVEEYLLALEAHHIEPGPLALRRGLVGPTFEARLRSFRDDIGFDLHHLRAWANWGTPVTDTIVLVGDFDEEAIRVAATQTPPTMTEHEHRGVAYYAWLDDDTLLLRESTPTNTLGGSRRIAIVDDLVFITRNTPTLHAVIDRHLAASHGAGARRALVPRPEPSHFVYTARGLDSAAYLSRSYDAPHQPVFTLAPATNVTPSRLAHDVTDILERIKTELSDSASLDFVIDHDDVVATVRLSTGAGSDDLAELTALVLDALVGGAYSYP